MSGFTEDTVKVYLGTETAPKLQELGVLLVDTTYIKVRFLGGEKGEYKFRGWESNTGYFLGDAEFEIKAEITSISPNMGSWMGGSILTLSGFGFSSEVSEEYIYFGDTNCVIHSTNDTQVVCHTLPPIYKNIEGDVPAEDLSEIGVCVVYNIYIYYIYNIYIQYIYSIYIYNIYIGSDT